MINNLPSDESVRTLLAASRRSPDPRSAAAVSLILGASATLTELGRMRWTDLDVATSSLLVRGKAQVRRVMITELLAHQLMAIPQTSYGGLVFAKPDPSDQSLGELLQNVLDIAALSQHTCADFTIWSLQQSDRTRLRVISL